MRTNPLIRLRLIGAFCVAFPCGLLGGSLSVSPVTLQVSNARPTAVITVENQGGVTRVYQLETFQWTQVDSEDVYATTQDLVAVPPVFKLAAGGKQIVRVGLQNDQGVLEKAYRLFIQEVPVAQESGSDTVHSIQTVLRVGIPVFVPPAVRPETPRLTWAVERSEAGATAFVIENPTNTHVQLSRITLVGGDAPKTMTAGFYLLAGEKRRWALAAPEPIGGPKLTIEAETDQGRIVSEAMTAPR